MNKAKTLRLSITMPKELKDKYSKLALRNHMSLSQLIRLALAKLEEEQEDQEEKSMERGAGI